MWRWCGCLIKKFGKFQSNRAVSRGGTTEPSVCMDKKPPWTTFVVQGVCAASHLRHDYDSCIANQAEEYR